MATSDAIVVGEEWISEHYFTTDAAKESFKARVLARRSEWDSLKEHGTPRTRFTYARSSLLDRFAVLDPTSQDGMTEVRALNATVRQILGYDRIAFSRTTQGPVTFVHAAGLEHTPGLAVIDARPVETIEDLLAKDADNLTEPFLPAAPAGGVADEVASKDAVTSVAKLLSTLFVHDDYKPAFALVLAGPHVLVAERERWPEGRYLAVDLQLVSERNDDKKGGEVDRALTCLAADSLAPDAQGDIWWSATLAESVKHTVGVSKDLREGVRLSIEIIANEVVARRKAHGLDPLPAHEAQPLAKQSLRFLYRILFLLFAEASPELGVLPTGAPEYENGYSLDRLRELILVELPTQRAQAGTHLYDSLSTLFRLVDRGHTPQEHAVGDGEYIDGLTFRSLRADLFTPAATAHIDEVGLGNAALQQVLRHLLLSKEQKGRDRGFISYAELGINQLGAVYEGLMSYTGFFAKTDLYEVAKDGNAEKGSWVVPVARAEGTAAKDFVTVEDEHTGERRPVVHSKGSFVFRLAGRERQQSASYYTPEVLTRFVVSQALEELLDQDGHRTTADEILELTICEPALGSGAFAIEAVRQLADQYLTRRQEELGETIDPDEYPRELQRVKAYLALHQTYGVDLNATAVELAEISLWLDTMVDGLAAPWFGLHLRRGNSLIGARNAVVSRAQVEDKSWLTAVPTTVGVGKDKVERIDGLIPHFLLPAEGWGAAADVGKEIKDLVPTAVAGLKSWRRSVRAKPTKKQAQTLVELGRRVERLWEIASMRLAIAEQQIRRDIPLWGREAGEPERTDGVATSRHVTREEIEASLANADGAYRRLRLVMDAWCALWFWPLTKDEVSPPALEQWYGALRMILGIDTMSAKVARRGDATLQSALTWDELGDVEDNDRIYADARPIAEILEHHPWLGVCRRIADQQGFFHWELDFAPVFDRGGFDLQVGNPPWVRPRTDVEALLAEGDPWWQLTVKATQAEKLARRLETIQVDGIRQLVVEGTAEVVVSAALLGSHAIYPHLQGLQPDLYRCFMERTWLHRSDRGIAALIHPETHFTDEKAGALRAAVYGRLRRHWQFINSLLLFEIKDNKRYGVHVYGAPRAAVSFLSAVSLYHPETAERSLQHDGTGEEPGLKNEEGGWDLRPHIGRITLVTESTLSTWHAVMESVEVPVRHTRMLYAVNQKIAKALESLAGAPRISSIAPEFSRGWDESVDRKRGFFDVAWGTPPSWDDVILQGPHLFVGSPFYKSPNETLKHNQDWSEVDLEHLGDDELPVTVYKPRGQPIKYRQNYDRWGPGSISSARDFYRVAWRNMADNVGQRTLVPAIIPRGAAHLDSVFSLGLPQRHLSDLLLVTGTLSSLVSDFVVRVAPKSTIRGNVLLRLPLMPRSPLSPMLELRVLRLNCLTSAYSDLWAATVREEMCDDRWTGGIDYSGRPLLGDLGAAWTADSPLRRAADRRQALVEIDALVAIGLGVSVEQLCVIYRTQFGVLAKFDRVSYLYDTNGREVPTSILQIWRQRGLDETSTEGLTVDERTATNATCNTYVYELPFRTLDREADMRTAYAHFEKVMAERTSAEPCDG